VSLDKKVGNINYIFCDEEYILEINKQYLNHDYGTDIITFDYSKNKRLHADIYICIDVVRDNKKKFKTKMNDELQRVILHGILHLAGYKDKTESEKKNMKKAEDYYLSLREF
jgi:rRNA maturation RNase YbeY